VLQLIMPSLAETIPGEVNLWCEVKLVVKAGLPSNEVRAYAEKEQIDLICLGKHGAGTGITLLFGSSFAAFQCLFNQMQNIAILKGLGQIRSSREPRAGMSQTATLLSSNATHRSL
jgi:hypothetical protein